MKKSGDERVRAARGMRAYDGLFRTLPSFPVQHAAVATREAQAAERVPRHLRTPEMAAD
jgi:hypothetical protein